MDIPNLTSTYTENQEMANLLLLAAVTRMEGFSEATETAGTNFFLSHEEKFSHGTFATCRDESHPRTALGEGTYHAGTEFQPVEADYEQPRLDSTVDDGFTDIFLDDFIHVETGEHPTSFELSLCLENFD
ncbi:hypothetical protein CkaCkLH20_00579 [Colletotrichum karsti]|uniref:Uncharacterized protein n=1 Tax=Colletotrichum karsti TaxID=1095194 RepID=A0A9P6IEM6_9PEZI|nr:uncharacterized protein CkaCkLH20_00579 [Colletotrichum karsti]KAF9881433.1 hypothetical protein CkaCkLH20_00579 [Colletotrichum karsti]